MLERFTDDARKVIFYARYEASRLGSPALAPEHLWLGLLRENKRLMRRLASHITVEGIHQRLLVQGASTPAEEDTPRVSMTVDLPLSAATARVFAAASAQADRFKQKFITGETLVEALLAEDQLSSR